MDKKFYLCVSLNYSDFKKLDKNSSVDELVYRHLKKLSNDIDIESVKKPYQEDSDLLEYFFSIKDKRYEENKQIVKIVKDYFNPISRDVETVLDLMFRNNVGYIFQIPNCRNWVQEFMYYLNKKSSVNYLILPQKLFDKTWHFLVHDTTDGFGSAGSYYDPFYTFSDLEHIDFFKECLYLYYKDEWKYKLDDSTVINS